MRVAAWLLTPIVIFPVVYQIRYSLATIEARQTFLYIPFHVKPFTNRIDWFGWPVRTSQNAEDRLRLGDELVAVNGRPFVGASVLAQELRAATRYIDALNRLPPIQAGEAVKKWPFWVTARSGGESRTVPVYFAHCTCGSLDMPHVYWFSIIPPVVCVAAGVIALLAKPRDGKAWAFFALMLALSQVDLVPEALDNFSQTADPMQWQSSFRIPSVAYQAFFAMSWPAWLLLFCSFVFPPLANRTTKWVVAAMVAASALEALLAVGWSESYRTVSILHAAALGRTELTVASVVLTAVAASQFRRGWAVASAVFAAVAVLALYWPTSSFGIVMYPHLSPSGSELLLLPYLSRIPGVIGAVFAVVMLLVAIAACWQRQRAMEFIAVFLFTIPLLYRAASSDWPLWWMPSIPSLTLASLYLGIIASAWVLARKTWPPFSGIGPARLAK